MQYQEKQDLKAGDPVGVSPSYGENRPWKNHNVLKVTKTQITLTNKQRYLKSTGRLVGGNQYLTDRLVSVEDVEMHNTHVNLMLARQLTIQRLNDVLEALKNGRISHVLIDQHLPALEESIVVIKVIR